MGAYRFFGFLAAGLAGFACLANAAPPVTPGKAASATPSPAAPKSSAPAPTPREWRVAPAPNLPVDSPELDTLRQTIDSLTPEQRQRFKENLIRWTNLSPEEKKALREREELRRNQIVEETERALKETGLGLTTPEQKENFARRYGEERRALEEQLRKEMNEKRRSSVKAIIGKLRDEFASGNVQPPPKGASATPPPAAAPLAGSTPPARP